MDHPNAGATAPIALTQSSPHKRQHSPLDLLTDDAWTDIIGKLELHDKLRMQQTCSYFWNLLANPTSTDIWGKLELRSPSIQTSSDVWQLCSWVLRRLEGISALCYVFTSDDDQQMQNMTNTWHALVAATADTGIRLKLRAHCLIPPGHVLLPPSTVELAQRLTAVSLSFEHPAYLAAVFCLSALRHLQLGCSAKTGMALLDGAGAGAAATPCQLSSLRTLQLTGVPPAALFSPATAACLQQLHSVSLRDCHLPDGVLPSELLRLPSLSRLDLLQLPLRMMPDLRGLPALRILIMSGERNAPDLDASQAECSADLKAALKTNPLGGATCLTAAVLHGIPVATRECAEAIARLPDLELLGVDFLVCEHSAFWAATLQRSMHWRCRPASDFVVGEDGVVLSRWLWPDEDW